MALTKEELKIIRSTLLRGSINEIVSITGLSRNSIHRFMYGKTRESSLIETVLLSIFQRDKELIEKRRSRIDKILGE